MKLVDFAYTGETGSTIYIKCFQIGQKLAHKTEEVFFFLIEQGRKNGYNTDTILEISDKDGNTCFSYASRCSEKICNYILQRDIRVNSINSVMMVPDFKYPELTIQMLKKGVNPLTISFEGKDRKHYHPSSFESECAKRLLAEMPRSLHFSIKDIECEESCPADCPSKLKRFYSKNGPLVEMTDENRIGEGGFGMVYKQFFHGKPMAMKCKCCRSLFGTFDPEDNLSWGGTTFDNLENKLIKMEKRLETTTHKQLFSRILRTTLKLRHTLLPRLYGKPLVRDAVENLENELSEMRIQIASAGSGVIVPVAFVRQQDQEQDENGEWIALNHDIYIYPLYDCNLYELHENYYGQFNDEILKNVLCQCLTRKSSYRVYDR